MRTPDALTVVGLGLFTPSHPTPSAWRDAVVSSEPQAPTGALLDRRSRRRASVLMKAVADAYQQALESSGCQPERVASIFGSALGEANTMIGILDQMWAEQQAPSPLAFATSVHNAASGAVSIGTDNREFTTSIAADYDTPAMSLFEARGLLSSTRDGVIVACADEASPMKIIGDDLQWELFAGALALVDDPSHPNAFAQIEGPFLENTTATADWSFPAPLARNPQAGFLALLDAIIHRRPGPVRLDRGTGAGWTVTLTYPRP